MPPRQLLGGWRPAFGEKQIKADQGGRAAPDPKRTHFQGLELKTNLHRALGGSQALDFIFLALARPQNRFLPALLPASASLEAQDGDHETISLLGRGGIRYCRQNCAQR